MKKKALITGVMGQDGSYLSKLLLEKGYKVYGATRRNGSNSDWRHKDLGISGEVEIIDFELLEQTNIQRVISKLQPDEVYNLAAQSFVAASFEQPVYTGLVDGIAILYILEAIRQVNPKIKFYQASTSEMFGKVQEVPQRESTPFYPRSPYGVAKLYAHWINKNYRESYDMFCCNGILFNHESPLRGAEFVTRKITMALANIKLGNQEFLELGNMDSKRDWGFAGDYVEGMYLMMQQEKPDDYVLGTNKTNTIRYFVEVAGKELGFDIEWKGQAENEIGVDKKTGKTIVKVNPKFYRPCEVDLLIGNPEKAEKVLGWKPKVQVDELAKMMVEADYNRISKN
ncbi:MAG TPA: GDP-mannose 4,6-dehydratase [Rickettsiales bacterium]|nr:GDP-mannose 4,6-dehydratase [Rickettsiales bacterium]